jgi:hypothetical protein
MLSRTFDGKERNRAVTGEDVGKKVGFSFEMFCFIWAEERLMHDPMIIGKTHRKERKILRGVALPEDSGAGLGV